MLLFIVDVEIVLTDDFILSTNSVFGGHAFPNVPKVTRGQSPIKQGLGLMKRTTWRTKTEV